jgi:RNA polymerase sigma-70 factor (ECF subfamily)
MNYNAKKPGAWAPSTTALRYDTERWNSLVAEFLGSTGVTDIDSHGLMESSASPPAEVPAERPFFERVFDEHYKKVFYTFRRKGIPHRDAEDLTQEAFLRVYEHLEELHSPSALRTWVFTVAENLWKNRLRGQGTQKRAHEEEALDALEDGAGALPSTPAEQEKLILDEERRARLRLALANLPPRMRQCVLLRLERGLKYKEIAVNLHVSIETVKAHLHQAKEILKRELGEYFELPAGKWGD